MAIFSFVAEVLKETEKAVYVRFNDAHSYRSRYVESWIPKSCLHSEAEAKMFEANFNKAKAFAEYLADKEQAFTGERVKSIEEELFA